MIASISRGPCPRIAAANSFRKSSAVSAREASTPIPFASSTQSNSGRCKSIKRIGLRANAAGARACHFDLEDPVTPVREHHDRNIKLFPRHGPERLRRVHGAAVGFECHHLPIGTRERRSDCDGKSLADGAACYRKQIVRSGMAQVALDLSAGRHCFIRNDRILR